MKELMRTRDVADLFGVEPETVRIWRWAMKRGNTRVPQIPFTRIGGRVLYRREDVETCLNSGRVFPPKAE